MKVNIHIMKSKKFNTNLGVRAAVQRAFQEHNLNKCTTIMFVYIDGDPILQKIIFLN